MIIDSHVHVAVKGDHPDYKDFGRIGPQITEDNKLAFAIMLRYARAEGAATDQNIEAAILRVIREVKEADRIVCLALDPIFRKDGTVNKEDTALWVANEYVVRLRDRHPDKVLFGASVHPFDRRFEERVRWCVDNGAALLKWQASSQYFSLSEPVIADRLRFLATAKNGRPLPLLLHIGPEHAIPSPDRKARSYDYIQWTFTDKFWNALRSGDEKLYIPDIDAINANIEAGLDAGAVIIFAHCGLAYYEPRFLGFLREHSDFDAVRRWIRSNDENPSRPGKCYADVSACMTPVRRAFFGEIKAISPEYLLLGSDFPVPVFELSADLEENFSDFKAMLKGEWDRFVIPQDNLIDVNVREAGKVFGPNHKLFTNFADKLL